MARFSTILLALGGGNALGSYQAGVYQALHERRWEPDHIIGTSAGAISGALIAGNEPGQRLVRLEQFWRASATDLASFAFGGETARRTGAALRSLLAGRSGVFGPIGPFGSWWDPDAAAAAPSLFDSKPLARTLARLVDFDRLNAGPMRFCAGAVDLETGEDMLFDTNSEFVGVDHIRASAALLPLFPPIEIGGRAFVDGGLSANLPLDAALAAPGSGTALCIAVDLLPLSDRRPQGIGEGLARAQNLIFAAQSRRSLERWQLAYASDPTLRDASMTLALLTYTDQDAEVAGKAMDFSATSARQRWEAGYRDALALIDRIAGRSVVPGNKGLSVVREARA